MSDTCYIFSPLILFHCFSQVATNFTFTSETSVTSLILKFLPSNAKEKLIVKIAEHKLEKKTFFHCKRRVFQLGQFNLLSVPISQQLPVLPLFNFWLFLIDRCNLTALFVDNSQVLLNNKPLLKAGNYPLASKKRQSSLTLQIWTVRRHVVLISSYVVQSVG